MANESGERGERGERGEQGNQGNRGVRGSNWLEGKWGFLFKAVLITTPAFWAIFVTVDLPWRIWVTRATFETQQHLDSSAKLSDRVEKALDKHDRDWREMDRRIENLPPDEWKKRILALEDWERENKADHAKIIVQLETIKILLDQLARQGVRGTDPGLPYNKGKDDASAISSSGLGSDSDSSGG